MVLEDDYTRLRQKLSSILAMEWTESLYFSAQSKALNEGLNRQLEGFLGDLWGNLQKMCEIGRDGYCYSSDYKITSKLKSFSNKYGICLLVVHHTRKQESEDNFDIISDANGLLGVADRVFIMIKESVLTI